MPTKNEPKIPNEFYLEPTEEDLKEFGKAALEAAFANFCLLHSN